jgi:hypothetical protein
MPDQQARTALETIAVSLCLGPPVVGWLAEGRRLGALLAA